MVEAVLRETAVPVVVVEDQIVTVVMPVGLQAEVQEIQMPTMEA